MTYQSDKLKLNTIQTIMIGKLNDIYVCQDDFSDTKDRYTIVVIKDHTTFKKYIDICVAYGKDENEFLRNAFEGFLAARRAEGYPMCGMDEATVDYIIAALALRFDDFDVATKLVSGIIVSGGANPRMKEKARSLKESIMARIKEKQKG